MMEPCSECGTSISSTAEVCPRCGLRFKPQPKMPGSWGRSMEVAQGVFCGMLLWMIFAALFGFLVGGVLFSGMAGR